MKLSDLYRGNYNATQRRKILRRSFNLKLLSLFDRPSAVRDKLPERILVALMAGELTQIEVVRAISNGEQPYGTPSSFIKNDLLVKAYTGQYDNAVTIKEEEDMTNLTDLSYAIENFAAIALDAQEQSAKYSGLPFDYTASLSAFFGSEALLNTLINDCGIDGTLAANVLSIEKEALANDPSGYSESMRKLVKQPLPMNSDARAMYDMLLKYMDNLDEPKKEQEVEAKTEEVEVEIAPITIKPEFKQLLDISLQQATGGSYTDFAKISEQIVQLSKDKAEAVRSSKRLAERLRQVSSPHGKIGGGVSAPGTAPAPVHGTASAVAALWAMYPNGEVKSKKAADLFRGPGGKASKTLDFEVPFFEWDFDHPLVPTIDPNYQFKPGTLLQFLWALNQKRNVWLHGHTGTGKTTFVEQVCARLGWPFMRINLDSEITRLDLIGRDVLASDAGNTISRFVEGILPQAMQLQGMGAVLCCDEISFGRPDVMYVFQRVLEEKGLLLNEDGGRLIPPGPWFRIVATDNTRGQGDELGAYAGARPQSAAFLDRFTCWIEFKYMEPKDEAALLQAIVPTLTGKDANEIAAFAFEVRKAFGNGEIFQTVSPRGTQSFAEAFTFFNTTLGNREMAIDLAANACVLSKASLNDRQVIKGLYDRTFSKR